MRSSTVRLSVHPRIRGERERVQVEYRRLVGSSPHTRGTPDIHRNQLLAERFIPAYAGNALPRPDGRRRRAVHPRIRGERSVAPNWRQYLTGSSPHTRGTPMGEDLQQFLRRFIPAYAGNAR